MIDPTILTGLPEFAALKRTQWARIEGAIPGLQFVVSGERQSQFMVIHSTDDHYEGVVIGQLPQVVMVVTGPPAARRRVPLPDSKKPLDKRTIDLSDSEIDAVLDCWRRGRSAMTLDYISHAYDRRGQIVAR